MFFNTVASCFVLVAFAASCMAESSYEDFMQQVELHTKGQHLDRARGVLAVVQDLRLKEESGFQFSDSDAPGIKLENGQIISFGKLADVLEMLIRVHIGGFKCNEYESGLMKEAKNIIQNTKEGSYLRELIHQLATQHGEDCIYLYYRDDHFVIRQKSDVFTSCTFGIKEGISDSCEKVPTPSQLMKLELKPDHFKKQFVYSTTAYCELYDEVGSLREKQDREGLEKLFDDEIVGACRNYVRHGKALFDMVENELDDLPVRLEDGEQYWICKKLVESPDLEKFRKAFAEAVPTTDLPKKPRFVRGRPIWLTTYYD